MFVVDEEKKKPVEKKPVAEEPKKPVVEKKPLVKHEYNGLFYAPELKKFVDPETDVPVSDFTFEEPTSTIPGLPGGNPVSYPTEDTVDWILEVIKGVPNFWYAKKLKQDSAFFGFSYPQWSVEATLKTGKNLVFAPGLFAVLLIKHGEKLAIQMLADEFRN